MVYETPRRQVVYAEGVRMKKLWMLVVATVLVVPNFGYSDGTHTDKPKDEAAVKTPTVPSVTTTPEAVITADKEDPCAEFRKGTSTKK